MLIQNLSPNSAEMITQIIVILNVEDVSFLKLSSVVLIGVLVFIVRAKR